jgi:hypothetical protein
VALCQLSNVARRAQPLFRNHVSWLLHPARFLYRSQSFHRHRNARAILDRHPHRCRCESVDVSRSLRKGTSAVRMCTWMAKRGRISSSSPSARLR